MEYEVGSAYVGVLPSLRGFQSRIRADIRSNFPDGLSIDIIPRLDTATMRAQAEAAARAAGQTVQFRASLDRKSLSDSIKGISLLSSGLKTLALPAAAVAATPYLLSLASSAVQAGGAVALLPALAVGAAAGVAVLTFGLSNLGDALGPTGTPAQLAKVNEALEKLSPSARETVGALREVSPQFDAMKLNVQQQLFEGLGSRVSALADRYLPLLSRQLGNLAAKYNAAAQSSVNVLMTPQSLVDTSVGLNNLNLATGQAARSAGPLTQAFRDLAVVGSEFLPAMGTGLANAAIRFRDFIAAARESGQLRIWIQQGIDVFRLLGSIAFNVGSILSSAFGAARGSGESFLTTIDRVTERMAIGLKTPAGAAELRSFFEGTRTVVGLLIDKVVLLWPAITAGAGALAAVLIEAGPLSAVLFSIVTFGLVPLLRAVEFLAPVLGPMVVLFGAWRIATILATTAMAAWRFATMLATAVSVAYQLAMGVNLALTNTQAAAQARFTVIRYAGVVATYAITAAQWLWNAAMSANPIGIVVLLIAGLVAAIVYAWRNFETFRNVVLAVWSGVQRGIQVGADAIKGVFTAIQGGLTSLGNWFNGVVDGIGRKWSSLKSALAIPINFLINTVWNDGMVPAWNKVAGWIPGLPPIGRLNPIGGYREGGPIGGRGTGTSDSNLALVSRGEFMVREKVASQVPNFLAALNAGQPDAIRTASSPAYEKSHFRALQSGRLIEGAGHDGPGARSSGFGGVKPHVARAGWFLKNMFGVSSVGGVGSRPGPSDHPRGLALDFMTYQDMGKGDRLANFAVQNAGHLAMKYIIWRQRINEGSGWKGMANRGSPTANHMDHPHISFRDGPGGGGAFSGAGGDSLFSVSTLISTILNPLLNKLPSPPPAFHGIPRGLGNSARDSAIKFAENFSIFDNGGMLQRGFGSYYNGTGANERVLDGANTRSFDTLVGLISSGRLNIGSDDAATPGGPLIGEFHSHLHGDNNESRVFEDMDHKLRVSQRGGRY